MTGSTMPDEGFLRRWSRRKTETRLGREPEPEPNLEPGPDSPAAALADGPAPHAQADTDTDAGEGARADAAVPALVPAPAPAREADASASAAEAPGLPTMDDVATLTPDSDYSSFVARGVDQAVRRSALKKLFADPHFNTMDRLDIYIDDYTKPSPMSETMLASLRHTARLFGRVADQVAEDDAATATATVTADPAGTLPPEPQDRQQVAAIAPDTASEIPSETASELPPETETR
jgi:hypothetical protein